MCKKCCTFIMCEIKILNIYYFYLFIKEIIKRFEEYSQKYSLVISFIILTSNNETMINAIYAVKPVIIKTKQSDNNTFLIKQKTL